jgi:hypothetical protein
VNRRDVSGLSGILADDCVFYSPVVHSPQKGKTITAKYLEAALLVLVNDSFHYVREVVSGRDAVLEFEVNVEGVLVNGVDMIRWDEEGRIVDFKVMIRPLRAISLVQQEMGRRLLRDS